jgi:hypothetical protein
MVRGFFRDFCSRRKTPAILSLDHSILLLQNTFMWLVLCVFGAGLLGLVAAKLDPRQRKRTALMDAIRKGDLDRIKRITTSKFDLNFCYMRHGLAVGSPLARSFQLKNRSVADLLISQGASLSPKSPGNWALLGIAVRSGNVELVELTLEAGHDLHFKARNSSRPLAAAIHRNLVPMARFLVSKGASKEDLVSGDCRWYRMPAEAILFVRDLGIEVPTEILDAIEKGEWDTPTHTKST